MKLIKQIKKLAFFIISNGYKVARRFVVSDNKTILFISYHGRGYSCNPKYIHQELLQDERFKGFNFIWALKDTSQEIEGATIIKYRSLQYFYYLAKSKIWISNCKLPSYCLKKRKQVYIQTWHGTPLKRLAYDINIDEKQTFYRSKMSKQEMVKSYDDDSKQYNYLISPNSFTSEKYQSCFKVSSDKIKEFGYPRNDFLVNLKQDQIEQLKVKLGLPSDKKIILYAPTWRDNSFNHKGYTFNLQCDFKKWQHYLEKDYVVIFKPHYLISNKFDNEQFKDFLYLFDANIDINELYAVSDLLITDYSSVFFDYSILDRPILFYMYDLDDYRDNLRGFYLDIDKDLPGQVVKHEEDLFKIIINDMHNFESIKALRKDFINKYHTSEQGNASKKIIDNLIYPNTK